MKFIPCRYPVGMEEVPAIKELVSWLREILWYCASWIGWCKLFCHQSKATPVLDVWFLMSLLYCLIQIVAVSFVKCYANRCIHVVARAVVSALDSWWAQSKSFSIHFLRTWLWCCILILSFDVSSKPRKIYHFISKFCHLLQFDHYILEIKLFNHWLIHSLKSKCL